jgi:hypothetical protein
MPSRGHAQEPICVETFCPDPAVERLRKGIVGWFAWPTEVQHNIMLVGPQIEILRDELGNVIDPDELWPPVLDGDALDPALQDR